MTAHRRENKGRHPVTLPILHDTVDNGGDVGDTAAADADRHAGTWPEPRCEAAVLELSARLRRDVGEAPVRKVLADEK
jgi:hypothetical protein